MYASYWKLNRRPFNYRVDVPDLYRSRPVQTASLRLRYCTDNNAGAALLLGPSGVGKSSVIRLLKEDNTRLRPFVHMTFPTLNPAEMSRAVAAELLGLASVTDLTAEALLVRQHEALRRHADKGEHPVIVFDEAHLLKNEALNEVVLPLLNLADTDYDLAFSIILVGQPVLASHVGRNAQLRERIAVTATMTGFSESETADYIHGRLAAAGREDVIFSDDAVSAVVQLSGGNPRRINRLCDMALLVGYSDRAEQICAADIESLATEILPAAA